MAATSIVEYTVNSIIAAMKAGMPQALANVREDRASAIVTTEPPVEYFIYDNLIGYKSPSIVVLATDADMQLSRGQNHVNCSVHILVSCIMEDRKSELLTVKAFRYSDAMYHVLNRAQFVDTVDNRKSVVKVTRMDFSRTVQKASNVDSPFRKEVMLTLDVEHYESEV